MRGRIRVSGAVLPLMVWSKADRMLASDAATLRALAAESFGGRMAKTDFIFVVVTTAGDG